MLRKMVYGMITALFGLFAFFQLNDPDSVLWTCYYAILSLLGILALTGHLRLLYLLLMGAFTMGYLIILLPGALEWIRDGFPSITTSMKAETPYVEHIREFLGLFIGMMTLVGMLWDLKKQNRL